jgi:hypothetical protein
VVTSLLLHHAFAYQTLKQCHIQGSLVFFLPAADLADFIGTAGPRSRQTIRPLLQELSPVDEYQRVDAAPRDQPRGDHRLPKGGGGGKNARVGAGQRLGSGALLGPELARATLVTEGNPDLQLGEEPDGLLQTTSPEADVLRMPLGFRNGEGRRRVDPERGCETRRSCRSRSRPSPETRKDDCLSAHAVLGRADYLVSGDQDLLAPGKVEGVRIVHPETSWTSSANRRSSVRGSFRAYLAAAAASADRRRYWSRSSS